VKSIALRATGIRRAKRHSIQPEIELNNASGHEDKSAVATVFASASIRSQRRIGVPRLKSLVASPQLPNLRKTFWLIVNIGNDKITFDLKMRMFLVLLSFA
jgi:hypothetical protein